MPSIWIKTIKNLREFEEKGTTYSIKEYHDKTLRLKGGKPANFTEKEIKACLTKDIKSAVADSNKLLSPVKMIAQAKHKYETEDAGSMGYWLKAGVALMRNGKDSPEYAKAMKSYVESLRLMDVWLGYDIDEIKAFLPAGKNMISEAELGTRHGQALEKYFKACAKESSLSKWKARFSDLSQDCTVYAQNTQMLGKHLLTIKAECEKQLKAIKEKKKVNLLWHQACTKRPPQDAKTMEKNNRAKKPSF
ncbi:MAG: hypothetical protein QNK42_05850 [Pseudodonghicola sp.]|nr:hypothetical protein [Pseudodonghicola sp.]